MKLHEVSPSFRHSDDVETIHKLNLEIIALKKHIENIITDKDSCAIEWSKCRERERVLTKAIENIAIQKLEDEMDEEDREGADYQKGYESIIKVARAALAAKEG